jgi:pyruvate kinase
VADVSNAILDGADACMLSGETAIGEYPREAVEMMRRIAAVTESLDCGNRASCGAPAADSPGFNPITGATVVAAAQLAKRLEAKLLVVASASGATALSLAKNRCGVPAVGVSDSAATLRRMCLYWGILPRGDAPLGDPVALVRHVVAWGRSAGLLQSGDRIVVIAGTGLTVSAHNMVAVHQLA